MRLERVDVAIHVGRHTRVELPFYGAAGGAGAARLLLSGVDLVDGTPILDVKPYHTSDHVPLAQLRLPQWLATAPLAALDVEFTAAADAQLRAVFGLPPAAALPAVSSSSSSSASSSASSTAATKVLVAAEVNASFRAGGSVMTAAALPAESAEDGFPADPATSPLQFYASYEAARRAVAEVLSMDPRPVCTKRRHGEGVYGFVLDRLNVIYRMAGPAAAQVCIIEYRGHTAAAGTASGGAGGTPGAARAGAGAGAGGGGGPAAVRDKMNKLEWLAMAKARIREQTQAPAPQQPS